MTTQGLLLFLAIGIVAGWLSGKIMKGGGFGLVGDLVVGVVGAMIGGRILGLFGIAMWGIAGDLLTALVGAVVLLYVIRLLKRI